MKTVIDIDLTKMMVENEEQKMAIFFSHFPLDCLNDEGFQSKLGDLGSTNIRIWNINDKTKRCYGLFIFKDNIKYQKMLLYTKTQYREITSSECFFVGIVVMKFHDTVIKIN